MLSKADRIPDLLVRYEGADLMKSVTKGEGIEEGNKRRNEESEEDLLRKPSAYKYTFLPAI